ncbi:hypothetical protein LTR17_014913 [Elasticomyces elasticus]|nr:hypothetical protein LTR17_014913 [Elasticomyces elasticus]
MTCEEELYLRTYYILGPAVNIVCFLILGFLAYRVTEEKRLAEEDIKRKRDRPEDKSVALIRADIARLKIVAEETSRDLSRLENELAKR